MNQSTIHPPTAPADVGQTLVGLNPWRLVECAFWDACGGAAEPRILWEDETLVGVIKPAGMLSTPDEKGRTSGKTPGGMPGRTPDLVSWLSAACHTPIYPVHRLDEPTAGVMVYAKSAQSATDLTKAMARGEWEKEYLALCHGDAVETLGASVGTLSDLLFRDAAKNKSYVVKRMRKGVREARLSYRVLAVLSDKDFSDHSPSVSPSIPPAAPLGVPPSVPPSVPPGVSPSVPPSVPPSAPSSVPPSVSPGVSPGVPPSARWSLLAVRLHTGRTHQIRVQFASRGLPLVGDGRYGGGGKTPPPHFSEKIPENFPEKNPEEFPEKIPENFSEGFPEKIPKKIPEKIPEHFPSNRLALFAYRLVFSHPVTKKIIALQAFTGI